MKRKLIYLFLTLVLIFVTIFFGFYEYKSRVIFDWDQEQDALNAVNIVDKRKATLIGPRVANEKGFFVPPWHYYFVSIAYALAGDNPYFLYFYTVTVNGLGGLGVFVLLSKIFNKTIGFVSSLLLVMAVQTISWNITYLPFLTLLSFCFYLKTFENKKYFLPLVITFLVACSLHASSWAMLTPIGLLGLRQLYLKRILRKDLIFVCIVAILLFLPLIIFDLRHEFFNIKKFYSFAVEGGGTITKYDSYILIFQRAITGFIDGNARTNNIFYFAIGLVFLINIVNKTEVKSWVLLWIASPLLILSQYKGNIPEYYYVGITSILPLGVAFFVNSYKKVGVILVLLIAFFRVGSMIDLVRSGGVISLADKMEMVDYLTKTNYSPFSISLELPIGMHTGYNFLFKKYSNIYYKEDGSGKLYTIVDHNYQKRDEVKLVYTGKKLEIVTH